MVLGSLATPAVEVQPSTIRCVYCCFCSWLTPASTRCYTHSTCQHSYIPGALVTKQVGQICIDSTTLLSTDLTWPPRRLLAFWSYNSGRCLCLFCQLSNKCTGQLQKTLTLTRLFHCQPLVNLPVKVLSS